MTTMSLDLVFDALLDASMAGAVVALGVCAVVAVLGRLPPRCAACCGGWFR